MYSRFKTERYFVDGNGEILLNTKNKKKMYQHIVDVIDREAKAFHQRGIMFPAIYGDKEDFNRDMEIFYNYLADFQHNLSIETGYIDIQDIHDLLQEYNRMASTDYKLLTKEELEPVQEEAEEGDSWWEYIS